MDDARAFRWGLYWTRAAEQGRDPLKPAARHRDDARRANRCWSSTWSSLRLMQEDEAGIGPSACGADVCRSTSFISCCQEPRPSRQEPGRRPDARISRASPRRSASHSRCRKQRRTQMLDLAPERKLHLRIGIHVSALVADEHDIYGTASQPGRAPHHAGGAGRDRRFRRRARPVAPRSTPTSKTSASATSSTSSNRCAHFASARPANNR